jgi:ribosomal protein S12 methylthiotransferase
MPRPIRVSLVSLGCAKNLVDSEKMLGQLAEAGCAITADEDHADVTVINTCGFLDASRVESDQVIREAVERKAAGRLKRVVVAGCLVQRDKEAILDRVPGIDALVGVNNRDDIVRAVLGEGIGRTEVRGLVSPHAALSQGERADSSHPTFSDGETGNGPHPDPLPRGEGDGVARGEGDGVARTEVRGSGNRRTDRGSGSLPPFQRGTKGGRNRKPTIDNRVSPNIYLADYHPFVQIDTARLRLTPRHYAYLRISEGCDQKCTFCTIPSIRGPMHCKPPAVVLEEARELVADGVREISLIGQDTTSYGLGADRFGTNLGGLLRMLDGVDGMGWIRLMYVYPSDFTDDMIDAIAECEHVCKYIDIPLQHVNDRVLKAMHRRINRRQTETLLQKIRDRIPGVTIRTTMIVGFPGETAAEFDELTRFVRDFGFDALGVFPYSREDGTPAGRMAGQIAPEIKSERVEALMLAQQEVAFALADRRIGTTFDVLVDSVSAKDGAWSRHEGQAPMVDSATRIIGGGPAEGEFLTVRCTARDGYDLVAEPVRTRTGGRRRAADKATVQEARREGLSLPVIRS